MTTHKYNAYTSNRIGESLTGLRAETAVLAIAPHFTNAQTYTVFNVHGMVKVSALYFEATGAWDGATTILLKSTYTTPAALTAANINAACASLDTDELGCMTVWQGTTIATVPVTYAPGIAPMPPSWILGGETEAGEPFVGIIAATIGGATATTASRGRYVCHYYPLSEGAYVEAVI